METISYRLDHYEILGNMDGFLWWESYAGFARVSKGRCFIESNVLFIEPAIAFSDPGFLIMEYNEALDALPPWSKTPHYCAKFTLKTCRDDKIVCNKNIGKEFKKRNEEVTADFESGQTGLTLNNNTGFREKRAPDYRLGRYEINEGVCGEFRWTTYTNSGRMKIGRGFIRGKILFLDGKTMEESGFSKRQFFKRLSQLPKWEKTPYYCTNYILKPCRNNNVAGGKQYGRSSETSFVKKRLISDTITNGEKAFKKIAEIITGIALYKNRLFKKDRK